MRGLYTTENQTPSSPSWPSSAKHHLQQLGKGAFVAGLTLTIYGLWKFGLKGASSVEIVSESANDNAEETAIATSVVQTDLAKMDLPVAAPASLSDWVNVDLQQASVNSDQNNLNTESALSLVDELAISFHEKMVEEPFLAHEVRPPCEERGKNPSLKPILQKNTLLLQQLIDIHTHDSDNPDPEDKTIITGEDFRIKIPGYKMGKDSKTYFFGEMTAALVDGSPLPSWMQLEPPTASFSPTPISTVNPGIAWSIAVQKDLALVAALANGLQLVNISDPRNPKIISSQPLPGLAHSVAMQEDVAFVAAYNAGLQLVGISDPRNPKVISRQPLPGLAVSVTVQREVALVALDTGLQLVNISDPYHPRIIGNQSLPGFAQSVTVQGEVALVVVEICSLHLVNISNPQHPKIISNLSLPGFANSVAVQGDVALVAADVAGLLLVNISDPQHPRIIGSQPLPGLSAYVVAQGDLVLVAAEPGGLQIVNITRPYAPHLVGRFQTSTDAYSVAVQNHFVFVGCRNGLQVITVESWAWHLIGKVPMSEYGNSKTLSFKSNRYPFVGYQKTLRLYSSSRPYLRARLSDLNVRPGEQLYHRFNSEFLDSGDGILPFQSLTFSLDRHHQPLPDWLTAAYRPVVSSKRLPGPAYGIAVQGDLALVTTANPGSLQLINISDIQDPRIISSLGMSSDAHRVAVQKDIALVTTSNPGSLQLVSIKDPKDAKIIGSLSLSDSAYGLAVKGKIALVAAGNSGLQLVNISDPQHIRIIGSQPLPGSAHGVTVQEDVALVAASNAGLQLVNISDPQNPKIFSSQPLSDLARGIALHKEMALVATWVAGLQLVNISHPEHPKIINSQRFSDVTYGGISVQNHLALVAARVAGLQLVDIKQPQHLRVIGEVDTFGSAYNVLTHRNFILVGTNFGLNILQLGLNAGVLSGQPTKADHANYFITITTQNSDGISANTTFRLSVNNPPVWKNPIANRTVNVGQVISFQLPGDVFWDADGDELKYQSTFNNGTQLPNWITFFSLGQIYTIIPSSANRGQYNISVIVDDRHFGQAQAWFSLIVPTRKPVKISDIPSQNAFIWRPFEVLVSSIFESPDRDTLFYRAQLKGAKNLPSWLHFDNTTCVTSCRFSGEPRITDLRDLEVELIATDAGGEASAEFSISINTSSFFQDLATYYSLSGAGLVLLSLFTRFWRWYKMREIHKKLSEFEVIGTEIGSEIGSQDLRICLQNLLRLVEQRETHALKPCLTQYSDQILKYRRQYQCTMSEIGNPWEVIKKIAKEVVRRAMRKLNYQDMLPWVETMHRLLQLIIETESGGRHAVMKADKELLLALLDKAVKYIEHGKKYGHQIKHQLQLCREALVSMDDTDSIKDNLCCRDSEMLFEIIKIMLALPYGIVRLRYQQGNIPSGWYPIIIQLCHLKEQALANGEKLAEFEILLNQQKDWRVVYEGIGLLGQVARETKVEEVQKQTIEGIQGQTFGLNHYQNYYGFWGRCSTCCDKQSAWIRARAKAEIQSISKCDFEGDSQESSDVRSLQELRISLLDESNIFTVQ